MLSLVILHKYTCIYLSILPIAFGYTRVYNISINKQRTAPQIAGSAASDRTVGTSQGRRIIRREIKKMTIKEIRKTMRALNKDGRSVSETVLIPGYGQIKKIGKSYAVGPLPENDDSDPLTDYSAWVYGWKESWVLDDIKRVLHIA